jgi:hypothetical protein
MAGPHFAAIDELSSASDSNKCAQLGAEAAGVHGENRSLLRLVVSR